MSMTKEQMIKACAAIPSPIDERDYQIKDYVSFATPIPTEYRNPIKPLVVLNQADVGCCVACSLVATRYFRETKQHKKSPMFSVVWIYGNREKTDFQGEGMYPREALKSIQKYGVPLWDSLPGYLNYPNATNKVQFNKHKLKDEAYKYRIDKYYACASEADIKTGIMQFGAVTAMFPAYNELMSVGSDGILNSPKNKKAKPEYGYHQMTITGWHKDKNGVMRWDVLNSWGKDWGDNGYCYPIISGNNAYPIIESWVAVDNIV